MPPKKRSKLKKLKSFFYDVSKGVLILYIAGAIATPLLLFGILFHRTVLPFLLCILQTKLHLQVWQILLGLIILIVLRTLSRYFLRNRKIHKGSYWYKITKQQIILLKTLTDPEIEIVRKYINQNVITLDLDSNNSNVADLKEKGIIDLDFCGNYEIANWARQYLKEHHNLLVMQHEKEFQ